MFNYASFCKVLLTYEVNINIKQILNQQLISPQNLNSNLSKVIREIFKLLISQASLRELDLTYLTLFSFENDHSQVFTSIPGVMNCLGNLSEFSCSSNICSCFFYQLSETCHNLQSLSIEFVKV